MAEESLNLATPAPQKPSSALQKVGLTLEAFGAGGLGQEPLALKIQRQDMENRALSLDQKMKKLDTANKVGKFAQGLAADKRQEYIDSVSGQFADDPETQRMIQLSASRPDLLSGLSDAVKNDPIVRNLAANDKLDELFETEGGRKHLNSLKAREYQAEWGSKGQAWIDWTRKNNPDLYNRATKDKQLSITEIRNVLDAVPENIKSSEEAKAFFLAPENQLGLSGIFGIPVVTDLTEQKKITKEADSNKKYQQSSPVIGPDGKIYTTRFDPSEGTQYLSPEGWKPVTAELRPASGGGAAPTANQYLKWQTELNTTERALRQMNRFFDTLGGTSQGISRWADLVSTNFKTLTNSGKLDPKELNLRVSEGELQGLLGLFREDVVGPGVMTEFDARRVILRLGGDINALQNKENVRELLTSIYEEKKHSADLLRENVNRYAGTFNITTKAPSAPDTLENESGKEKPKVSKEEAIKELKRRGKL